MESGIVVIGASWGGLLALGRIIGGLPADFPLPVVIVQHRGKTAESLLAQLLQDRTELRVCEVEDKQPITAGSIYVAPPDYHLLVEVGDISLTVDAPVRYSRPSIDVTFISAADSYGKGAIGVVLTGANDDGARGLRHIVDRGGRGIVQDPEGAEVRTMPDAARRLVPEAEMVPLDDIAARLVKLTGLKPTKPQRRAS